MKELAVAAILLSSAAMIYVPLRRPTGVLYRQLNTFQFIAFLYMCGAFCIGGLALFAAAVKFFRT